MRFWRDLKGVVHILDGYKFPWCDSSDWRDPKLPNNDGPATCISCIGNHVLFHTSTEKCEECGADVPNLESGCMTNKHHTPACSLHDPDNA